MPAAIRCPQCHYELDSVPGEFGQCPECGGEFQRDVLLRRRHSAVDRALAFMGYGAFGVILAEGLAKCVAFMPRGNEGTAGDSAAATEWLRLIPVTLIAAGLVALAHVVSRRPALRIASFWVAGALWAIVIHEAFSTPRSFAAWPWLQPQGWSWSRWVAPLALYGTMGLCCVQLHEVGRMMGSPGLAKLARVGLIAAAAALAMSILVQVFQQFTITMSRQPMVRPGSPVPAMQSNPTFVTSGGAMRTFQYFSGMLRVGLWLGIGVMAVTARGMWVREEGRHIG